MSNFSAPNTLFMSDSLKDKLTSNEDDTSNFEDAFIIVAVSFVDYKLLVGSLMGISFENDHVKMDVKISLAESHDFIGEFCLNQSRLVDSIEFHYGTIKQTTDNYCVEIARVSEIDHTNKMAILALDLVKTA